MHANLKREMVRNNSAFTIQILNHDAVIITGSVHFEPDTRSNETVVSARIGISRIDAGPACPIAENDVPSVEDCNPSSSTGTTDTPVGDTQPECAKGDRLL